MSVKSKYTVTKFPDGTVYIAGPPEFVGKLPPPRKGDDPEIQELFELAQAVLKAGDEKN